MLEYARRIVKANRLKKRYYFTASTGWVILTVDYTDRSMLIKSQKTEGREVPLNNLIPVNKWKELAALTNSMSDEVFENYLIKEFGKPQMGNLKHKATDVITS